MPLLRKKGHIEIVGFAYRSSSLSQLVVVERIRNIETGKAGFKIILPFHFSLGDLDYLVYFRKARIIPIKDYRAKQSDAQKR